MDLLDGTARRLAAAADVARVVGRTVVPGDPNPVPERWTHVTKVDPEGARRLPLLYPLYLQHTDAISVGGSSDVTAANTAATFELLAYARAPSFHEPSDPDHITPETRQHAAFLAIPEVLNGDVEALVGDLGAGVERLREEFVPALLADQLPDAVLDRWGDPLAEGLTSLLLDRAVFEAYVVQNPDSAAAERAGVGPDDVLDPGEARRRAMAADRHLRSEVVYLEYSGSYGGEDACDELAAIDDALVRARLWYGGGLDARERTEAVLSAGADAVVVGNALHAVAEEEAALCSAAAGALDADADEDAVRDWLDDRRPLDDTAAAGYLSTVPAVDGPAALAGDYLAATVRAFLGGRRLADGADPPGDPDAFESWAVPLADGPLPGERAVRGALPRGRDVRPVALAALAAVLDLPAAAPLPAGHLTALR